MVSLQYVRSCHPLGYHTVESISNIVSNNTAHITHVERLKKRISWQDTAALGEEGVGGVDQGEEEIDLDQAQNRCPRSSVASISATLSGPLSIVDVISKIG